MTYVSEEIASQPGCWAAAATLAATTAGALPAPGDRVAVVGCGTSYHMGEAYARLREASGQGLTDAMPASELRSHRQYDRWLFLSRSGTTTEVLQAMEQVPKATPSTAIVGDASSPVATKADVPIVLDFANERSIVQTRFATSLLVLLRAHLGQDVTGVINDGRRALAGPLPEGVLRAKRFTFLGRSWTIGLALEAALKLREAAQVATEAYPAMEFRHGPISVIDAESVVWSLGGPDAPDLASDLAPTGASLVVARLDPLAELVRVQRVAVELATARHLDPDHPRNLSFSVILGAAGQSRAAEAGNEISR
ncbi:MAG: SIS domain-containing protein [Acidimicrobiales bacterium]